jgi:hypothetical protein
VPGRNRHNVCSFMKVLSELALAGQIGVGGHPATDGFNRFDGLPGAEVFPEVNSGFRMMLLRKRGQPWYGGARGRRQSD